MHAHTRAKHKKGAYMKIKVKPYCINKGTSSQYFGLKDEKENRVLESAPNNWKTEKGALHWALNNGFKVDKKRLEDAEKRASKSKCKSKK